MREGTAFRRHPRASRMLAAALALVLGVSGLAAAPASAAKARMRITYTVMAGPQSWKGCVGQAVEFEVLIYRSTKVNGRSYGEYVPGGSVSGAIERFSVGRFEPADLVRSVGAQPHPAAKFVFRAEGPGRTDITFIIQATGEERRVGTGHAERSKTVKVEVVDCWEAYTSGLATTFSKGDMGDLSRWFLLEGAIASSTVEGATQYMFFLPNPQNRTTGGYVFVDTAWATANPRVRCTAYVSGRYDVVFYPDEERAVEGDLLMSGTGVAVCAGHSVDIAYASAGFRIGFRPRAPVP